MADTDPQVYLQTVGAAHMLRQAAKELDVAGRLDQALEAIEHADAVGPILDPTMWRDRSHLMHEDREALKAVRALARIHRNGG